MDTDELEPIKKKQVLKDLDAFSIEALGEYIEELLVLLPLASTSSNLLFLLRLTIFFKNLQFLNL